MSDIAFDIEDLREAGDAGGDLMGFFSRGHHDRFLWAQACNRQNGAESSYDRRHVNSKQVRHVWWRTVPMRDQPGCHMFATAEPHSRGSYPATVWDDLAEQDLKATKHVIREHHRGRCNGIAEGVNWALKYLEGTHRTDIADEMLAAFRQKRDALEGQLT